MSGTEGQEEKKEYREPVWLKVIGIVLASIGIALGISFIVMLFWLNMFPVRRLIKIIFEVVIFAALALGLQFVKIPWVKWAGRVVSVLLIAAMIIGDIYIYQTKQTFSVIGSSGNEQTDVISVYVLSTDEASTIADAKNYNFGYHTTLDRENTDKYIKSVNETLGSEIKTTGYTDLTQLVDGLYKQNVQAIIVNESYVPSLKEEVPDFESKTKLIANEYYTTVIEQPQITKNTLTDTFTIYLSGNDECGELNQSGRSDVNILIVVNPKTKQILLVNTPRDYYVDVYSLKSGTGKDKLTHAGNFGVAASMKTLSVLYDNWDIDYFVRLNFTSTEEIIDVIGGITVDSKIEFTTHPDTSDVTYHFVKGKNKLDGKAALAFCRERQNVAGGDSQRGEDQMLVIKALVEKVSSTAVLYNYSSLLDTVKELIQTNLSDDDIASMVKLTMDSVDGWNVQTYAVSGEGFYGPSYFFGYSSIWMCQPDMSTVKTAIELMNRVKNGEILDLDEDSDD